MKKIFNLLLFALIITFWSCEDKTIRVYEANSAITMSYEDWREIKPDLESERTLENPGKIYMYKNALYINERGMGIHVYDNSDSSNPIDKGFINIHCNLDVAVYGNTLYAGSYSDLLIFDVSNPLAPKYVAREKDVFDVTWTNIEGYDENLPIENIDLSDKVIIRWETKTVKEEIEVENSQYNDLTWGIPEVTMAEANSAFSAGSSGGSGVGGSMASFTIQNEHLYVLDHRVLKYSSLSNPIDLPEFEELNLFRDAETLYPYDGDLFIGTTTGMLIYDIAQDGTPEYISSFNHWTGCDPVVVSETTAYVTLSSGCGLQRNELHVVDISDLSNPSLIKSYEFEHPLGLGVDENTLFLCDDDAGLKVFDVTNPETIQENMIKHYSEINAYDVIPWNNLLIMVGDDGVYQYNYSDPNNIVELSKIEVK